MERWKMLSENSIKYKSMENENKDKNIILTDEQLKEVAGGAPVPGQNPLNNPCPINKTQLGCMKFKICIWKDGKCISKFIP